MPPPTNVIGKLVKDFLLQYANSNLTLIFHVRTVHLVQFITQTYKCTTYIYIKFILYIVSPATYFNASLSSSKDLILIFC